MALAFGELLRMTIWRLLRMVGTSASCSSLLTFLVSSGRCGVYILVELGASSSVAAGARTRELLLSRGSYDVDGCLPSLSCPLCSSVKSVLLIPGCNEKLA